MSVADVAYSSVAPPVRRWVLLAKVRLLHEGARKNQSVCRVEATVWLEMQWLAVRKYGVPDEPVSLSSVPVQR